MSEWIKVSERLPEPGWKVLTSRLNLPMVVGFLNPSRDKWLGMDWTPTHWMELPEPPKRESSFEQWWARDFHSVGHYETKAMAKYVWNAAVILSKSPNFVP